jgi:16S rRNA (cytosine1402-N4)-methyltransferase
LALRIYVNKELEHLEEALKGALTVLQPGGRLVVLSYHSLEDRLVKGFLRREASECICPAGTPVCVCGHTPQVRLVYKRVVRPSPEEVQSNPRSRSARLRAAERL